MSGGARALPRREEGASTVVLYEAQLEGLYEPQLRLRAGISSGASAEHSDRELDAIQLEAEPDIAFNCSSVNAVTRRHMSARHGVPLLDSGLAFNCLSVDSASDVNMSRTRHPTTWQWTRGQQHIMVRLDL